YLRHEPVLATPLGVRYRVGKFVRRHRFGVSVIAPMILLVVGFGMAQTVQLRRITRERDRADRITDFMISMFNVSDPSESRGNSITAREILDKASDDIEIALNREAEVQAQMMTAMGNIYSHLGLYKRGQALLTKSLDINRRVLGREHPSTLRSMTWLASTLERQSRYADAEKLLREVLEVQKRVLGREHPETLGV